MNDEQMMFEMERRLRLVETVCSHAQSSDEKVQAVMRLHEEAEEENKILEGPLATGLKTS